jgi:3-isopropylmalate dehydrogenase
MEKTFLTDELFETTRTQIGAGPHWIGLLPGEGVGPEIVEICREILQIIAQRSGLQFEIKTGGLIGQDSWRASGRALSEEVIDFCRQIFAAGGAVMAGPGGGRFVYDLRREFDLFFKLNPLFVLPELEDAAPVKQRANAIWDIVVVRDNQAGLYQGTAGCAEDAAERSVLYQFHYTETQVRRLLQIAARLAARRQKRLTVVGKQSGLPELTQLWFDIAQETAQRTGVTLRLLDVDFAAYQLVARPEEFDVVATPNCFGDILADLGGALMGSRGVIYGASYSSQGFGVYQTNHGSAYDLAGKNSANPAGQLFSLAMLLRESWGLKAEADWIEQAVRRAWREGWRTADVMAPHRRLTGTREFGEIVGRYLLQESERSRHFETTTAHH